MPRALIVNGILHSGKEMQLIFQKNLSKNVSQISIQNSINYAREHNTLWSYGYKDLNVHIDPKAFASISVMITEDIYAKG